MWQEKQWYRRQPARGLFNPRIYTTADLKKRSRYKAQQNTKKKQLFQEVCSLFRFDIRTGTQKKKKPCKYEQQYDLLKTHFLFSLLDPTYKAIKTAPLFPAVQVRAS